MKILFEINLINIDKTGEDHFKKRKEQRLLFAEPDFNSLLISTAAKENNLSKEELLNKVNEEVKAKLIKNIASTGPINVTYAVIPVGIIYLKYKDKKEKFNYFSPEGQGHVYYIPVTKNVASTLMITNDEVPGEWKRQHSTRNIPLGEIEYIPLKESLITIDLEKIIHEIQLSKLDKPEESTFNISELLYEVDSDYRPKRDGKQNMFKLKTFDKRSFPIITTSGNEFQKDVKVKVDSSNAAQVYSSKLTGRKNGLKTWIVKAEGTNLIFKDCYTTLGFNKEGNFKGLKGINEALILNYKRLLKRLYKLNIKLL